MAARKNYWTDKLTLAFRTQTEHRRTLRGYAAIIERGLVEQGISLVQLADRAGVSASTIAKHLAAGEMRNGPTTRTLANILAALDWEVAASPQRAKAAGGKRRSA